MRTIIDLSADQLEALDSLCRREGISRAEGVRRAVAEHVRKHQTADANQAFGLWRARSVDGLAYERHLRREWDVPAKPAARRR
jgi:ribbon-helix-helix CopG family protein